VRRSEGSNRGAPRTGAVVRGGRGASGLLPLSLTRLATTAAAGCEGSEAGGTFSDASGVAAAADAPAALPPLLVRSMTALLLLLLLISPVPSGPRQSQGATPGATMRMSAGLFDWCVVGEG